MADVKPWTDAEIETEIAWLEKLQPYASRLAATLCELLDLRAKVTRFEHECQTARAERDLAREHLADANKAKGGAK